MSCSGRSRPGLRPGLSQSFRKSSRANIERCHAGQFTTAPTVSRS
ncbi:hypothetical protein BZL30_4503 [Mycobacterium kansasii]|uniref:Uncharacterized protein n=1 Tax=Mycobacterium kansasii TaxID=1768 RepID=A0A1V3X322_MYCKA|nr:hypothetical protein BZL30_4503 [Mycobacterium kansasii]